MVMNAGIIHPSVDDADVKMEAEAVRAYRDWRLSISDSARSAWLVRKTLSLSPNPPAKRAWQRVRIMCD
jgi:hypothetical protein